MKKLKINIEELIEAYNNGQSLYSLARTFNTYATTIKRILERNNVELRHDVIAKGELCVTNGEKLIEWAKAQGRLVTKAELAKIVGTNRLSPSYFIKYPELGKYIQSREQQDLHEYSNQLYIWLNKNNILYKPNDRTKLKVSVSALLLGKYSNIILQIAIKPKYVSLKKHSKNMIDRKTRAHEQNMTILFIHEEDFENLDKLKERL